MVGVLLRSLLIDQESFKVSWAMHKLWMHQVRGPNPTRSYFYQGVTVNTGTPRKNKWIRGVQITGHVGIRRKCRVVIPWHFNVPRNVPKYLSSSDNQKTAITSENSVIQGWSSKKHARIANIVGYPKQILGRPSDSVVPRTTTYAKNTETSWLTLSLLMGPGAECPMLQKSHGHHGASFLPSLLKPEWTAHVVIVAYQEAHVSGPTWLDKKWVHAVFCAPLDSCCPGVRCRRKSHHVIHSSFATMIPY